MNLAFVHEVGIGWPAKEAIPTLDLCPTDFNCSRVVPNCREDFSVMARHQVLGTIKKSKWGILKTYHTLLLGLRVVPPTQ